MSDLISREEAVAEYRERMIQAFHNADCDNLIAVVVLPTEKEFQHLEWLLKKEYVPFLEKAKRHGKWIKADSQQYFRKHYPFFTCSACGYRKDSQKTWNYCPNCGARMIKDEETD